MVDAFHRDPESYQTAKKELKRAALEFHRFLELLKDYQVLKTASAFTFCSHVSFQGSQRHSDL